MNHPGGLVNMTCETDMYLSGMYSDFVADMSDRVWRFECCHTSGKTFSFLKYCEKQDVFDWDELNSRNGTLASFFSIPLVLSRKKLTSELITLQTTIRKDVMSD